MGGFPHPFGMCSCTEDEDDAVKSYGTASCSLKRGGEFLWLWKTWDSFGKTCMRMSKTNHKPAGCCERWLASFA